MIALISEPRLPKKSIVGNGANTFMVFMFMDLEVEFAQLRNTFFKNLISVRNVAKHCYFQDTY